MSVLFGQKCDCGCADISAYTGVTFSGITEPVELCFIIDPSTDPSLWQCFAAAWAGVNIFIPFGGSPAVMYASTFSSVSCAYTGCGGVTPPTPESGSGGYAQVDYSCDSSNGIINISASVYGPFAFGTTSTRFFNYSGCAVGFDPTSSIPNQVGTGIGTLT